MSVLSFGSAFIAMLAMLVSHLAGHRELEQACVLAGIGLLALAFLSRGSDERRDCRHRVIPRRRRP